MNIKITFRLRNGFSIKLRDSGPLNLIFSCLEAKDSVWFSHLVVSNSMWTPWTVARQDSLSNPNSWSLLKLISIESAKPSNHLILCHPLLPPSIFPRIRIFSNESVICIRRPKYWSFSFSISPFNECSGLISFRMDWLDLRGGTLRSVLQHHNWKASILGTQLSL